MRQVSGKGKKSSFWRVRKLPGAALLGLLGIAKCPVEASDHEYIVKPVSLVMWLFSSNI